MGSSRTAVAEGYVKEFSVSVGVVPAEGYVKEFTRHSSAVLRNLNELRLREILTDATLLVRGARLRAHRAVLIACSGFFYSLFSRCGPGALSVLSLPESLDPEGVSLLLDFMYSSRLPLSPHSVGGVLAAATYLQMEHVADTCRSFIRCSGERTTFHPRPGLDFPSAGVSLPPPAVLLSAGAVPVNALRSPVTRTSASTPHGGAVQDSHRPQGETTSFGCCGLGLDLEADPPRAARDGVKMEVDEKGQGELSMARQPALSPLPTPDSPSRSSCHPNSPSEASGCGNQPPDNPTSTTVTESSPNRDPKACNWKKYKYIVLNPLCRRASIKGEEGEGREAGPEPCNHTPTDMDRRGSPASPAQEAEHEAERSQSNRCSQCQVCQQSFQQVSELCHHILVTHPGEDLPQFPSPAPVGGAYTCSLCQRHLTKEEVQQRLFLRCRGDGDCDDNPNQTFKCDSCCSEFRYRGNLTGNKTAHRGEKPYRCSVCGAQFNRPANLKTHSRIHSGEKPYPCETCGARFVQVAHLRAHVLIHTGEKPYPCETCGTRFRHLQTLKSHVRIHTGEKPYHCEKCDLHFRHKSQLRLHLRQKHGAITNTKIRYKVLSDPYRAPISSC
ncbi:B-cell lymphoma 6 protein homolog [Acipenser ruthenus]|uniref:B-cell lymphoma 6 protein homolog n=1 Tax=Acipenser ruthenus TaxID=7906 RepID=UPI0027421498|nr:B-cell lymphoma 6 protein homolog [Acipenser ruthenus]XP_058870436.1 B-cell lymphoma 6 protein homolog [Acipenser ruthenus]XP_058870437.1 B-cell lymphoma 6 protein homolog [Acipenser ruthenus]XP_058870438.1 B-cell lymphoma 6 protein homolog [Acipenser ruthenus]